MQINHSQNKTPPKMNEIVSYNIGDPTGTYDWSWIENHGDIIMKIKCIDGMFVLIRKKEKTK